jgi:hypothetical protein
MIACGSITITKMEFFFTDKNRCSGIPIPSEGEFVCNNENLSPETECQFICPLGKMPIEDINIRCIENVDTNDTDNLYVWDKDVSNFQCVQLIR